MQARCGFKRHWSAALVAVALALSTGGAARHAAAQSPAAESRAILTMMQKSADDWNRGDLQAFASCYKNSPDILFMGVPIRHGYREMLDGYRKGYPTRAAMGQLHFTDLAVQPLDARFATITGRFHLDRNPQDGGKADGYFLLVTEKTNAGWKIVRDDTTPLPEH